MRPARIFRRLAFALLALSFTPLATAQVAEDPSQITPIQVGEQVPDTLLFTVDGNAVTLHQALLGQPAALIFYRGGWCPYCNRHLAELRKIAPELKRRGFPILAISVDRPAALRKGMTKTPVDYTLLSDAPAELIRALGIAFRVDDATVEKYRGYGIDLEQASGHDHHILPVPTVLLVDRQGTVQYRYSNVDYKVRIDNAELLDEVRALTEP